MSDQGHIELERRIDSIVIGERHRRDVGDLTPLMDSLQRVGLLQPVTISPDGYLICGYRRLEAATRLGWSTLRVWVRSGISDELTRLLAERDDNATHKPLSSIEAAHLFAEMKALLKGDAERRKRATQFGSTPNESAGQNGGPDSGPPSSAGRISRQAALMVTHKASHARLEQILEMERVAANRSLPADLRKVAVTELESIRNGGAVDPGYQRVKAAQRVAALADPVRDSELDALADDMLAQANADRARRIKENRARRASAAANVKRSPRAFLLTWAELDGWSKKYDIEQIAAEVKADDWALFLRVLDETKAFADAVHNERELART
jgi:ParB family chromosome partitioning protein